MSHNFHSSMVITSPISNVFSFFVNAANLQRITPPELCFRILNSEPIRLRQGTLVDYHLRLYSIPFIWFSQVAVWDPTHWFMDVQTKGPYKKWAHINRFREQEDGTQMIDEVLYQIALLPIGEIFYPLIHPELARIFLFREKNIRNIFEKKAAAPCRHIESW